MYIKYALRKIRVVLIVSEVCIRHTGGQWGTRTAAADDHTMFIDNKPRGTGIYLIEGTLNIGCWGRYNNIAHIFVSNAIVVYIEPPGGYDEAIMFPTKWMIRGAW